MRSSAMPVGTEPVIQPHVKMPRSNQRSGKNSGVTYRSSTTQYTSPTTNSTTRGTRLPATTCGTIEVIANATSTSANDPVSVVIVVRSTWRDSLVTSSPTCSTRPNRKPSENNGIDTLGHSCL